MLHISCNLCTRDLPDTYDLSPQAFGVHIKQIPCAHINNLRMHIENTVPIKGITKGCTYAHM